MNPHKALYCDIDEHACQWIRNLIDLGEIAPGDVTSKSIVDLTPTDIAPYTQFHAFAGVSVWSRALRDAGVPDSRVVWSASLPCQCWSVAGKRKGKEDERHLFPDFFRLVDACRPPLLIGEQVASKDALDWFDGVRESFASIGYSAKVREIPASGVGGPHIRQRLWFVAEPGKGVDEQRLTDAIRRRTDQLQSSLFNHQWKIRTTPAGYSFPALRASPIRRPKQAPSPSLPDQSPWNTPRATDGSKGGPNQAGGSLPNDASVASWPTPAASDGTGGGQVSRCTNPARSNELPDFALLANWKPDPSVPLSGWRTGSRTPQSRSVPLSGWQTPAAQEAGGTPEQFLARKRQAREHGSELGISLTSLSLQAQLGSWLTPSANEDAAGIPGAEMQSMLGSQIKLTGWPTPTVQDSQSAKYQYSRGDHDKPILTLSGTVDLAAWPTPNVPNGGRSPKPGSMSATGQTLDGRKRQADLGFVASLAHWTVDHGPARLTENGLFLSGSFAEISAGGQLNPAHSAYLMGLPEAWLIAAPIKQKTRASRTRSSKAKSSVKVPGTCTPVSPESECSAA